MKFSRMRLEAGEILHRGFDVGDVAAELAGDLRIAVHLQVFEMFLHQLALQLKIVVLGADRILLDGIELNQQAFLKISRADAGWIERLDQLKRFGQVLHGVEAAMAVPFWHHDSALIRQVAPAIDDASAATIIQRMRLQERNPR